jgi:glutathione S-transferase
LLEELSVPYTLVRIDMSKKEHKAPEYLNIHPHGQVPAFVDGDLTLFESAAICAYLADKVPEMNMAPAIGTPERGLYYQWLVYSMATLEPPIVQVILHTVMLPEAQRSAAQAEEGRKNFAQVAQVIEKALSGKQFMVGDRFSVADIMIGSTLGWAQMLGMLGGYPALEAYVGTLAARPAFQRAHAD